MTKEELYGVARAVLAALGGLIVGKGWIDSETMLSLAGDRKSTRLNSSH